MFHWVNPISFSPTPGSWQDVRLDDYIPGVPANANGVILWYQDGARRAIGIRKKGSTDSRISTVDSYSSWAAIGIDGSHYFQVYRANAATNFAILGYTTSDGVVFFDNGIDKSIGNPGAWVDIDCHIEAPGAIALIFEVYGANIACYGYGGFRKKGSTDSFTWILEEYSNFGVIIGCDNNQVCQGYMALGGFPWWSYPVNFYLLGYVTAMANVVIHTNGINIPGGAAGWSDRLLSSIPGRIVTGGFFDIGQDNMPNAGLGVRGKGDSTPDVDGMYSFHHFPFVRCDSNRYVQVYVDASGNQNYYEIGVTLDAPLPPSSVSGIRAVHKKLLLGGA